MKDTHSQFPLPVCITSVSVDCFRMQLDNFCVSSLIYIQLRWLNKCSFSVKNKTVFFTHPLRNWSFFAEHSCQTGCSC